MFNVGIGEIAVIVLVCLIVFGPDKVPEIARQVGRFLGQLRLTTQGALDQLKEEAELKDLPLPDLRVGSLRSQAADYLRQLMDIEGQMAELEREREQLKRSLKGELEAIGNGNGAASGNGSGPAAGTAGISEEDGGAPAAASTWETPPVDPEAT